MRDSLRDAHGSAFAQVSVVGIVLDRDIDLGYRYVESLGPPGSVFDKVALGGSWLNEEIIRLVWRDGAATPHTPQVVLFQRNVDSSAWPGSLEVGKDSLMLNITGRDDLIAWVEAGTPMDFAAKAGGRSRRAP